VLAPRLLRTRAVLDCGHTPPFTTALKNVKNAPFTTSSITFRTRSVAHLRWTIRWIPDQKTLP
ncbi:uncharacterized protein METZ01_LOCUS133428, partial [marine metagenome]